MFRNRVRTKEERKDRIAKSIEESNKRRGIVKAKVKTAEENRAYTKNKKEANKYKKGDVKKDLWEVEGIFLRHRVWFLFIVFFF